jgi:hypothetical protein
MMKVYLCIVVLLYDTFTINNRPVIQLLVLCTHKDFVRCVLRVCCRRAAVPRRRPPFSAWVVGRAVLCFGVFCVLLSALFYYAGGGRCYIMVL